MIKKYSKWFSELKPLQKWAVSYMLNWFLWLFTWLIGEQFIFDETRKNELKEVNTRIGIKDDLSVEKNKTLIFVYCPPKVGSTTVVSSLRLSASNKVTVIHLHNDVMLKVLFNVTNTTVNEIIHFNRYFIHYKYLFNSVRLS
jgi:hypothetical protein